MREKIANSVLTMVFSCLPIKLKPEFLATASVVKITHIKIIITSREINAVLGALLLRLLFSFIFDFHILFLHPYFRETGLFVNSFLERIVNIREGIPKTSREAQIEAANANPQRRLFIAISPP